MSQEVKKRPFAALIIESSQNYFNQRGLIYLSPKKFSISKVWGKTFFRCEKPKLLKCPLPPPPPPKYKQTNLQILYHFSTRKMAYGLFKTFSDMKCFRPLLQRSPLKCFPSPPLPKKKTNKQTYRSFITLEVRK